MRLFEKISMKQIINIIMHCYVLMELILMKNYLSLLNVKSF